MAVPNHEQMLNPTLQAFHQLGGSASISELEEAVAKILNLSEKDLSEIHRGSRTKFNYRLAWTRNYLKQYGLLENSSRGVWALTPRGIKTKSVDPKEVVRKVTTLRKRKLVPVGGTFTIEEEDLDEEDITSPTSRGLTWKEELLDTVQKLNPSAFERLCQRLLRESGFIEVEITGKSKDGGIDGRGVVRIGGLLSFHVIFQAKRYKGSVSSSVVRDFRGAMVGRADKGLLITTGSFTRDARLEAQRDGAPPIDLIDGEDLAQKLKSLSLGIQTESRVTEIVNIKKDWFLSL